MRIEIQKVLEIACYLYYCVFNTNLPIMFISQVSSVSLKIPSRKVWKNVSVFLLEYRT